MTSKFLYTRPNTVHELKSMVRDKYKHCPCGHCEQIFCECDICRPDKYQECANSTTRCMKGLLNIGNKSQGAEPKPGTRYELLHLARAAMNYFETDGLGFHPRQMRAIADMRDIEEEAGNGEENMIVRLGYDNAQLAVSTEEMKNRHGYIQ